MNTLLTRVRRIDLRVLDAIVAAALALDIVLEALLADGVPHRLIMAAFAVPFAVPIALRRRWPAAALIAGCAIALLQQLFHGQMFNTLPSQSAEFVPILCSYGVGAWLEPRRSLFPAAVAAGLLLAVVLVATYVDHVPGAGGWSGGLGTLVFFVAGPWVVGRLMRERGRRAAAFAALEAQAVSERAERERAAISEERLVIGRELQDIIAHSVSVMVVQAGGARRLLRREPDRARESILAVERTGRETLAEMRRLLGLLRRDDDPGALTPQPGLEQLPELAVAMRARGLECSLCTEGDPIELTPGIDLVGYRAIEAALDGAAASGCQAASTMVRYESRRLELEVRGDRSQPELLQAIAAASERVRLYGGRLELHHAEDGAFALRCQLPLEGALAA
jgi:signal transduction histidine kinase